MIFHELFIKKMQYFGSAATENKKKQKRKSRSSNPSQKNSKFTSANTALGKIFKMFTDQEILLTKESVKISVKQITAQS